MATLISEAGSRAANENARDACEYGPLATRRKRLAVACRCAAHWLPANADPRVRRLLDAARACCGTARVESLSGALREAESAVAELDRRATTDVWSIFEGLRAGGAADAVRRVRTITDGVRWALGTGGSTPPIPSRWVWLRATVAETHPAPVCDPNWRTFNVLTLARLVQNGDTNLLPILADALQDAGCEDERVLDHCRAADPHSSGCWVPDLILNAE